jgi:hypothetical protein
LLEQNPTPRTGSALGTYLDRKRRLPLFQGVNVDLVILANLNATCGYAFGELKGNALVLCGGVELNGN